MNLEEKIKKTLYLHIAKTIFSFNNKKYKEFIQNLLDLKNILSKIDPKAMTLDLVDFAMDENMWDWVVSSMDGDFNEYDVTAAEFITESLKEIIEV